jgi:hypothetical protein
MVFLKGKQGGVFFPAQISFKGENGTLFRPFFAFALSWPQMFHDARAYLKTSRQSRQCPPSYRRWMMA